MEPTVIQSNGHTATDAGNLVSIDSARPGGDPYAVGKRRVAIVGFAPSSCMLAPFDDPTWTPENAEAPSEIWGLNELYKIPGVKRAERWFDVHDRRDGDISHRDPQNIAFLKSATIPIFMQDHFDDIPNSVRYPIELVVRHFRTNYFTNTISFELALAIMEGRDERGWVVDPERAYGEIRIYGVDMAQDAAAYSEYREQRPSCEYLLGWARGIGIKTYIPPESDLLKTTFMYGYEGTGVSMKAKMNARRKELQDQINGLQAQAQAKIQEAQQMQFRAAGMNGALEDTNYWDRCWTPGPEAFGMNADGKVVTFDGHVVKEEPKKEEAPVVG